MKLTRSLYSLAMWLAQPVLRTKLRRRAVAEPAYAMHLPERFGQYESSSAHLADALGDKKGFVWIHAVSLGETRAAAILLAQLRPMLPGMRLLLTHGTATGRAEGAKLLQLGDVQVWQPWDTLSATAQFFQHFRPRIGIVIETEVWPNLCAAAAHAGVPMVLANARLNDKSQRAAQRIAWLARPAYASFVQVWAQTDADAQRLKSVGARNVTVQGNIKFDATESTEQVQQGRAWHAALQRPVVMLASSREGEEALFLEQIKAVVQVFTAQAATNSVASIPSPNVQWLIVPRHPQRFDEVAALITKAGFSVSRRSQWASATAPESASASASALLSPPAQADVWLGDSLGEMALYYGLSDCALLGGSFAPLGGQNLIEAIAAGCPVMMGPHTFNFADAAATAQEQGAALRVADMTQGVSTAIELVTNSVQLKTMQTAGEQWLSASRGAAQRMAQAVVRLL
jgi:3-deoxy-D-manno-octulosonic-acid transferase